jgi:hypothetical protein
MKITTILSFKKLTHLDTKSSEIIISSRTAGSTLQKRSLLYNSQKTTSKRKKKNFFFSFFDFVDDIQITTHKFCIARMYSCMCGVFILKKPAQTEIEKLFQKFIKEDTSSFNFSSSELLKFSSEVGKS